jgi:hypothetical protein
MLERGRAHPVLGPILLIVLVLLLAMVFLHAAHDGNGAATEVGAICIAIVSSLGLLLLQRLRTHLSEPLIAVRGDRGPPSPGETPPLRPAVVAARSRSLPLRR